MRHVHLDKIKSLENAPKKINIFSEKEIKMIQELYNILPEITFNKNETLYFMCFRFIGGGGTPFPIQNILPVLFNMSSKNYIIATLVGILPTTFVTVALGNGIEKIIDQNAELSFLPVIQSP